MNSQKTLLQLGISDDFINPLSPTVLELLIASGCSKILGEEDANFQINILQSSVSGIEGLLFNEGISFSEQLGLHTLKTRGVINSIVTHFTHHLKNIIEQLCHNLTNENLYTICTILRAGNYSDALFEVLSKNGIEAYTISGYRHGDELKDNFIILELYGVFYIEGDDELIDIQYFESFGSNRFHGVFNLYGHQVFLKLGQKNDYDFYPIINIDLTDIQEGQYKFIQESNGVYHFADLKERKIYELGFADSLSDDDGNIRFFLDSSMNTVIDFVNGEFSSPKIRGPFDDKTIEGLSYVKLH